MWNLIVHVYSSAKAFDDHMITFTSYLGPVVLLQSTQSLDLYAVDDTRQAFA